MSKDEIKWTKGTDRPLQDVLFEQWQERVHSNPTEITLAMLEDAINGWEETIQNYEQSLSIHNYHHQQRIDMRLHIRKLRELVKRLRSLLDEQGQDHDLTDQVIQLAIQPLKKVNKKKASEFMKKYASLKKSTTGYNPENFIEAIGWAEHSRNTQRDWMEKYDDKEVLLSGSQRE